ncbi:hypothetical protein ACFCV3_02060 [Kribbella sp. NPDC056345]|uniref:hypothetical protein n=1 Tax=Kribbella sp. NPDC056345 TaxID=3345789 RepID=UPI0035E304D6
MFDVGPDGSPLAKWQADTAATVARLLTRQEKGVVIAETTGNEPQIAESLRAAAALRQLGRRATVKLGVETPDGLVREETQEPLLLTRLRVLATGAMSARLRAAVRERLRTMRPGLLRHDPAAVTATAGGVDVLERAGDLQDTDLPGGGLCPAAGEDRVIVATGLLSLARRIGVTCAGADAWAGRAAQAVLETDPVTPQGQEIALTAGKFLVASGRRLEVPDTCLELLRLRPTYRELIPPIAYQTCAEYVELSGTTVEVDDRAAGALELRAEVGGRIDEGVQIDATGLHYSVLVLRMLGFRAEHLDAVRETPPMTDGSALDNVRIVVATSAAANLPAQLAGPYPVGSADDSYAAALAVNAGGTCPARWRAQPSWRTGRSGAMDSFELLRHATIVAAQAKCSNRPVPTAERRLIEKAGDELSRSAWKAAPARAPLTDLWKAYESRCLVGAEPGLSDSLVARLPDYSSLARTEVNLAQLMSAVRLSDLARHGCGPARWPLAGA